MLRITLVLIGVLLTATQAYTQIVGAVVDEAGEAVAYASVTIHQSGDSTLVTGVASGELGRFSLDPAPGTYLVKVSFLSYSDTWIPQFEYTGARLPLGRIILSQDQQVLDAIEVVEEKNAVEMQLDKRVFNVQKDPTNRGRNASEILDNIPSVGVDMDGNVNLRGSNNVRVLIDGKPSALLGISNADALRQLQGDMIESVEVVTNPSAKYEAEGEVGIINIKLKKERKKGVNGSIDGNLGSPSRGGLSGNLNYRRKDINFFTSLGANYIERPGSASIYQRFILPDTSFVFDNTRAHNRTGVSANLRLGAEFFFTPKKTLTVAGLSSRSAGDNSLNMEYRDFDESDNLTQVSFRDEEEEEETEVLEFEMNYLQTFSNKDHKLEISAKRQYRIDEEVAWIQQTFNTDASAILLQQSSNTENEWNWIFQSDYTQAFSKERVLEAGLRMGLRDIANDFRVEQFDEGWRAVPGFVNDLRYREDISAAYVTFGDKVNRLSYKAGLRLEHSDVGTALLLSDERNDRDYLNLFPSAFIGYEYSDANSLQLSYSRRINRPRFWDLVPFFGFGDPRNFYSGNPDLDPEYTHSVELNRLNRSDKGSIVTGVFARYKEGVIQRVVNVGEEGTTTFPVNLGRGLYLGIEISGSQRITPWWRLNGSVNINQEDFEGEWDSRDLSYQTTALRSRLNSRWTILKDYDFQASLMYRSPRNGPQGRNLSMTALDLGLSKDMMKGKATLTLSVRDVFNSRVRRRIIERDDYYSENSFQWRQRSAQISFNYRINQKKRNRGSGGYQPE